MVSPIGVGDLPSAFLTLEQQEQTRQAARAQQNTNEYWKAKIAAGAPQADVALTKAQTSKLGVEIVAGEQTNEQNAILLDQQRRMRAALARKGAEAQLVQPQASVPPVPPGNQQQPVAPGGIPVQTEAPTEPAYDPYSVQSENAKRGRLPGSYVPFSDAAENARRGRLPVQPPGPSVPSAPSLSNQPGMTSADDYLPVEQLPVEQPVPPPEVAPQAGPATPPAPQAQPAASTPLATQPVLNGRPNFLSDAYINASTKAMQEEGVFPDLIQTWVDDKLKNRMSLEEKLGKIAETKVDVAKKAFALKNDTAHETIEILKREQNNINAVNKAFELTGKDPGTPEGAKELLAMQANSDIYQKSVDTNVKASKENRDRIEASTKLSREQRTEAITIDTKVASATSAVSGTNRILDDISAAERLIAEGKLKWNMKGYYYVTVDSMDPGFAKALLSYPGLKADSAGVINLDIMFKRIVGQTTSIAINQFVTQGGGVSVLNSDKEHTAFVGGLTGGGLTTAASAENATFALKGIRDMITGVNDTAEVTRKNTNLMQRSLEKEMGVPMTPRSPIGRKLPDYVPVDMDTPARGAPVQIAPSITPPSTSSGPVVAPGIPRTSQGPTFSKAQIQARVKSSGQTEAQVIEAIRARGGRVE